MAKVKVIAATFKREVETKNGKMFGYEIKLENDNNLYSYLSKSNPQTKFIIGVETDAELTQNDKGYWNIKPAITGGGNFQANPQRLETDKKIAALNNAVNLVCAGKVDIAKLKETYDKLLKEYL